MKGRSRNARLGIEMQHDEAPQVVLGIIHPIPTSTHTNIHIADRHNFILRTASHFFFFSSVRLQCVRLVFPFFKANPIRSARAYLLQPHSSRTETVVLGVRVKIILCDRSPTPAIVYTCLSLSVSP